MINYGGKRSGRKIQAILRFGFLASKTWWIFLTLKPLQKKNDSVTI